MIRRLIAIFLCIQPIIFCSASASQNDEEYRLLDDIAIRSDADKSSKYHNYTQIYARYFAPLKDKSFKFLEIGIQKGFSVKLWEAYFKSAELHFMDITFEKVEYYSKRSKYHLCNQESFHDLQRFIQESGGDFDVILDDGGHTMNQQITSFTVLFPIMKSGGMYIIEDLHTSYWQSHGGSGPDSAVNFLKKLVDDVNYVGARTGRASHLNISAPLQKELNLYQEKIESIHFYDGVAIIIKR